MSQIPVKKEVLGVMLTDSTLAKISEYIIDFASMKVKSSGKGENKLFVVTPNPEMVVYANSHKNVLNILNEADIAICDGVGLSTAAHFLGSPIKRITGVDLLLKLCSKASKQGLSIGLLGGSPGVAELVAECLREKYEILDITFTGSDWDVKKFPKDGVDLLFVAYGFPKQEIWISENLTHLPVKMAMGVGGAFDYISGGVRRAPFFIRAIGLEWAFRLINQPWRIKRQIKLVSFTWLVVKSLFGLQLNRAKS